MQTVIHEYVRERIPARLRSHGSNPVQVVGVMVALVDNGLIRVGWSKTNIKMGDVFDKDEGIDLAISRAYGNEETPAIPAQMIPQYRALQIRALRYFQQATFAPLTPVKTVKQEKAAYEQFLKSFEKMDGITGLGVIAGDGPIPAYLSELLEAMGKTL